MPPEPEEEEEAQFAHQDPYTFILTPRLILNVGSKVLHRSANFVGGPSGGGTCLGCGWEYRRDQVHLLHGPTEILPSHHKCKWASRRYTSPAEWTHLHENPNFFEEDDPDKSGGSSASSSSSAACFSISFLTSSIGWGFRVQG